MMELDEGNRTGKTGPIGLIREHRILVLHGDKASQ